MQTQNHRYALRCLSAQGIAPTLADEIQVIYDRQLAIAKTQTIEQAKTLVKRSLATLPPPFVQDLDDQSLSELIHQLL